MPKRTGGRVKLSHKYLVVILFSPYAFALPEFDLTLIQLNDKDSEIDLSVFNNPEGGMPGVRDVAIYVNGDFFGKKEIFFKNNEAGVLKPAIPLQFMHEIDITFDNDMLRNIAEETFDLEDMIPYSKVSFNEGIGRLDISIPQTYFKRTKYKISPELWDDGIPAIFLDYNITANKNHYSSGNDSITVFSNFISGANILGWRWRGYGTYNYVNVNRVKTGVYNFNQSYVEKDIRSIDSTLVAGLLSTSSSVLDNVMFNGVQLKNNKDMVKGGLYSYTPVIRGIANSYSEVELSQNGRVVYKTNVPPGPFELDNVNIPVYGGDIIVTIKEASGETHSFTQTYSTLAEMLRPGIYDYNLSVGETNYGDHYTNSKFIQGDYARGIDNGITLYGASLLAENYYATALGSTYSFGKWGAASADATFSYSEKDGKTKKGQSYNVRYSKSALSSGTTVTLASYRYASRDFFSFAEHLSSEEYYTQKIKSRWSLLLSQSLFDYGHININGNRTMQWNGSKNDSLSLSHTFYWNKMHFNSSYSVDYYDYDKKKKNRQFDFGISVPFSLFKKSDPSSSNIRLGYSGGENNNSYYASAYGKLSERIDYSTQHNWNSGSYSSGALALNYNGNSANVNASYTKGGDYQNGSFGISGSMLLHERGLTLSPDSLSNGAIIVNVDGVSDAYIQNSGGLSTDWLGNAAYSGMSFYNRNTVKIDATQLPDNIVLMESEKNVYPSRGAFVMAKFDALIGQQVVFTLKQKNGNVVPFGAVVSLENAKVPSTGIVGDDGKVYLAGIPDKGKLKVSWGKQSLCLVDFDLSGEAQNILYEKNSVCS